MASLEGIVRLPEPTRMRLLVRLPFTARHHHRLWLGTREGPGERLLIDLLSSCSGLRARRSHDADCRYRPDGDVNVCRGRAPRRP